MMLKRIIALLLIAICIFVSSGCKKDAEEPAETTEATAAVTETEILPQLPEETVDPELEANFVAIEPNQEITSATEAEQKAEPEKEMPPATKATEPQDRNAVDIPNMGDLIP